jgi:hypothetical protein
LLRAELNELKLMALQKRAVSCGVGDEDLEDALDADDPKAALIDLVVATSPPDGAGEEVARQHGSPTAGCAARHAVLNVRNG